uniref:Uncharacterized protein n=1 Tax=viral metagenome TaxID=1070528 RepID=A0A6C0HSD9_9ZZZZ
MHINLVYSISIALIFMLLKFLINYPKREEVKNVVKEGVIVFVSALLGLFLTNKFGTIEVKNFVKSTQVFTDNAGF